MDKKDYLGNCPICERQMVKGPSVDKHHFLPKCKGGKETQYLHRICHRKIHSLFTEKECAEQYNNPNKVLEHPDIQVFVEWVRKKDVEFYDRSISHNRKRK